MQHKLKFRQIVGQFAVCRLPADTPVPAWASGGSFSSITRTPEELSIVCALDQTPAEHKPKVPWMCLKLEGPFDFLLTGVLASFLQPLGEQGIPIFAISTYDTDYVLILENFADRALEVLKQAGHQLISN